MLLTSTKSYADLLKLQCKYQGLAAGQFSSLSGRQPCIICNSQFRIRYNISHIMLSLSAVEVERSTELTVCNTRRRISTISYCG
jgi:hypothetical protein